uniref:Uncharacterized protein n=2 Tax=Caenorhabditis japonica TaxID=281687 RepID=A0A8R1I9B9_CAEJA
MTFRHPINPSHAILSLTSGVSWTTKRRKASRKHLMRDVAQLFDLKRLMMTTDSASLKSSEGTCSSIGDEREKAKIVQKLVEIKDKLRALNEKHEVTEYDNRNNEVKKSKGCDNNGVCQTNGKFDSNKNYDGSWSQTDCCTGNYCNGANASGLLALPIMLVTYFLFK